MKITDEPFYWLNKDSETFLRRGYLLDGVDPKDRVREIADTAQRILGIDGFSDKFYDYMSKGYYSLSSPVWSNFGLARGLPISCFGSFIEDSIEGILTTHAEVGTMSKVGGGTSAYFGAIRPRGSKITDNGLSDGSFTFARLFDTIIDVVSQGTSRKGQFAGYIDIESPDIEEWLNIHKEGNPIQLMYYAVVVGSEWLTEMKLGDPYKRKIWAKVLQSRSELGIPYIMFRDNANENTVDVYKDKRLKIHASNLCSEIMLPSSVDESFVCCLSSLNLARYDDWKDTDAVETITYFLDAVMEEFITKASKIKFMERTVSFASSHRALGVGVLGWHDYLQDHGIPFESMEAMDANVQIFKLIRNRTYKASSELAKLFGEPEILKGYGRRNTTTMAVAPTKSSSFILGCTSQSIEPLKSNYYIKDLAKIKVTYKNPRLIKVLQDYGKDTPEVWESILLHEGSVQHLSFLSDYEKDLFKTFEEINQVTIIQQAAQRQKFIDQGQSLNLTIHPETPAKMINQLILTAEELGIKALYYQFSTSAAQKFNRKLLDCNVCGG